LTQVKGAPGNRGKHAGGFLERPHAMQNPKKLREMAAWYRKFAERAGNPMIWECRLHTAEDLEAEARRIEKVGVSAAGSGRAPRRTLSSAGT
jgi:hypothetical protein